jgi:hypothetical protein
MQKKQRNILVESIQAVGLNPLDFELQENDLLFDVHIKHKHTSSWFDVRFEGGLLKGKYVVGDDPEWSTSPASTWHSMHPRIRTWLEEVKSDLETPDKLAELQRKTQLLIAASDRITDNAPFAPDEQRQIVEQLRVMIERAHRAHSLSPSQVKVLDDWRKYVVEASHRLGRKDWFLLFAGAMFTYLPTLLPPEAIRDMSLSLLKAIGHLHGFPDLPLLP